jgi:P27 family predicted phage terminase small subunit
LFVEASEKVNHEPWAATSYESRTVSEMGKRGPARTPTNTLSNRGSWLAVRRKEDEPDLPLSLPPCPKWVSEEAAKHWDEIGNVLYGMGLMSVAYTIGLAILVQTLADYIKRCEQAEHCEEVVYTEKGAFANPIHGMKDRAEARLLKIAQQFGLTPATISQVKVDKPKEEKTSEYRTG